MAMEMALALALALAMAMAKRANYMTDLDSMYKRLIKAGNQTGKDQQPGLLLSFDAYCALLGVEPNKQHYDKWKETASLEAWEKQNNTDQ